MNFSYFKEKNLTLKRYILLAILTIPALAIQAQNYNNIEFIENKGQWDNRVKYKGDVNAGAFFIRNGGFTVVQHNPEDWKELIERNHSHDGQAARRTGPLVLRSHAWNVDFVDASSNIEMVPDKVIPTYNNYFIGNDPSKWASNCRIFQAMTLKNVYPNIDVRYYTDNGTLKYDILVKPGGNPNRIALKYDGVDKIQVKNKELVLNTSLGERKESSPYTYQYQVNGKQRQEVTCKYTVKDNVVRFNVKDYDPTTTLVIDPTLIFCSFSGSTADNWGFTATYGPDGAMYGGGIVHDNGFPTSPGAYQTVFQGGSTADGAQPNDIGIIKLTPNGSNRVYATYIGGSGNEQPHSLVVDQQGNLVIAGRSSSPNFPTANGGLIGTGGGFEIVVLKLNATGTGLIGSRRIGGSGNDGVNITPSRAGATSLQRNYGDDGRSEVILDGGGNVYVASSTQSSNFPTTAGSFQPAFGGGPGIQDAVFLKFNPTLSTLLLSSYLGGTGNDAGYVLSIGPTGNIFIAGGTESNDFPGSHAGTVGAAYNGNIDGFIAEINAAGTAIVRSTYIGTSAMDQVFGIQFDRNGFPYAMGQTTGNWPIQNATFSNAGGKQFIVKLQPDLSSYVYSTVFGTNSALPNISPIAFLVDRCENVYVSGWGGTFGSGPSEPYPNAGTAGLPVTADAIDPTTDGRDLYFFVLRRDATAQLYGSFFGQNGGMVDHVDGGTSRFDANGIVYQAICGNCLQGGNAAFPTTPGAWATTNPSGDACNLAMVKIAFNLAGVGSDVSAAINGVPMDTAGCVPLTVTFTDLIRNAESYIWDFGDGTPPVGPLPGATGYTQTHTYTSVGTFQVMLIAIDPTTCNVRDTSYINIRVGDLEAQVDGEAVKIGACTALDYQFNNLSIAPPPRPFTDTSFSWNFGDGSPVIITGTGPVTHTFPTPGSYTVILTLRDTAYCNYPDADTIVLSVASNVDARFSVPPVGCVPYTAEFKNESIAGETWEWDFGDGVGTSTNFEPTYTYNVPGTYTVRLIAINPNTCNIRDTAYVTITVSDIPTANFSVSPTVPVVNAPHFFTNLSSPDAVRFKWLFGDGDTLVTTSRAVVQHQYNATGTFDACLIAYNVANCPDTVCQQVSATINPVMDVPNAFTPNSGDINSVVMVRGFGIAKMRFIIWNRWGQKVFETGNRLQGWDGKYKGQVQPMDVYAYTLDVEFFNGTKATKKGDITLIR